MPPTGAAVRSGTAAPVEDRRPARSDPGPVAGGTLVGQRNAPRRRPIPATLVVMGLAPFDVGRTVVVEERWHGLLWSAVPHRVVASTQDKLVSWVPDGTVSTR